MPELQRLPPLSALRVFESAARHLNFTRAADELGMTQAAVSYQIKILEERMRGALFLRQARSLQLTELGERLAPGIHEAFSLMRDTVTNCLEDAHRTLTISTVQTFAARWLVSRIGAFQLAHPELAVRINTDNNLVDFNRDPVDVVIRFGAGKWPGLESHLIVRTDFTILAAPALAEQIKAPGDVLKLPRAEVDDPWWQAWFAANKLVAPEESSQHILTLDTQALIAHTVINGDKIALLTPEFFRQELASGTLVQPFPEVYSEGRGCYLAYPTARRNAPHIKAFREWIETQRPKYSKEDLASVIQV